MAKHQLRNLSPQGRAIVRTDEARCVCLQERGRRGWVQRDRKRTVKGRPRYTSVYFIESSSCRCLGRRWNRLWHPNLDLDVAALLLSTVIRRGGEEKVQYWSYLRLKSTTRLDVNWVGRRVSVGVNTRRPTSSASCSLSASFESDVYSSTTS